MGALALSLVLAGCAKDSGTGGTGGPDNAEGCITGSLPAPVTAATTQAREGEKVDGSKLKIGLAYDIGGRGDASFNDAAAASIDRAKRELGVTDVKELSAGTTESEADKQTRLRQLVAGGSNVVLGIGFAYSEAVAAVAPKYPKVRFAVVDGFIEKPSPNVTLLTFAEHEGSFLVGAIAAMKSKSCKIGFVGGVRVPLIEKFEAGFKAGVEQVAPDATVESRYLTEAGDFTGFQDAPKGEVATKGLISEKRIDVVYHAAGKSGIGVFAAAKEANIQAIGVDSDQYNQKPVAAYKDAIITSMLKRVDVAVFDYLVAVARNDLSGLPEVFDLKVDGVGFSTTGGKVDDVAGVINAYKQQIVDGKITVPDK